MQSAQKAFDRNLITMKNREGLPIAQRLTLFPYLCVLEKEEYIKAIIRDVRRLAEGSETFSPSLWSLCYELGVWINKKYEVREKKKIMAHDRLVSVGVKLTQYALEGFVASQERVKIKHYVSSYTRMI